MTGAQAKVVAAMHELASQAFFNAEVSHLSAERLAKHRGWVFHKLEYPTIDCEFREEGKTTIRLQFQCDNWNEQPPSISLLTPEGAPLTALPSNPTSVFNFSAHPHTGRSFICMRGSREYHTHPSHLNDPWDNLKGSTDYTLGGILTQIWNAWRKGT